MSFRQLELVCATADLLECWMADPAELGEELQLQIPSGWPEFPEAMPYTLAVLAEPGADAAWWMYFFVDRTAGQLLGSGGFKGAPVDGRVEIGYEIAPEFRGQGLATQAAGMLVEKAVSSGSVQIVQAQTLPGSNPSTAVLSKLGFRRAGDGFEAGAGDTWLWELATR